MIKISVDESFGFDLLAILQVKRTCCADYEMKERLRKQILMLQQEINEGIGYDLGLMIYNSEFYQALYKANYEVFNLIDESHIRNPGITLKSADETNYRRFIAKQKLQQHFFKKDLNEIKIGYNEQGIE